jgi:hypothetical protein
VERAEYLEAVQQSPWAFPAVDGCPNPPDAWVAAAWDTQAVQGSVLAEIVSDVSKTGDLFFAGTQDFWGRLSTALSTRQVVRLFRALRNESPHREAEFRPQFEQAFARHAAALPPPLTRREVAAALGLDDATAAEFLGVEPGGPDDTPLGYSYGLVSAEAFTEGRPEDHAPAEGGERFTIDQGADRALHRVFTQLGGPLRFAIAGDHCPQGSYDDLPDRAAAFSAWVTPGTVRQVAAALARLPRWRVIEVLRALDRWLVQYKEGRALYSAASDTVQAAYSAAAKKGAGLHILAG